MKREHPILFSTPMVQAILEGRKTMTRRIVKLKYLPSNEIGSIHKDGSGKGWVAWSPLPVSEEETKKIYPGNEGFKCPYGNVGDTLWVRETWVKWDYGEGYTYKADGGQHKWKPSIFMPRSACRIFLEITDIKVERLQDITNADAKAEGIPFGVEWSQYDNGGIANYKPPFKDLWQKINGKGSWQQNPWVWVVSFNPGFGRGREK